MYEKEISENLDNIEALIHDCQEVIDKQSQRQELLLNDNLNHFRNKVDALEKDSLNRLTQLQQSLHHRKNTCASQLQLYEYFISSFDRIERSLTEDYSPSQNSRRRNAFQVISDFALEFKYYDQILTATKRSPTLLRCYRFLDGPLVIAELIKSTSVYLCLSIDDTISLLQSGWQGLPTITSQSFRSTIEEALGNLNLSTSSISLFSVLHCEIEASSSKTEAPSLTAICICCQPSFSGGLQGLCQQIEENLHASALPSKTSKKSPIDILAEFQGIML